jgi:hypothetical protein
MEKEITIPEHFPELKEEGVISAEERRKKYSSIRDQQADAFNKAIVIRLLAEEKIIKENPCSDEPKEVARKK